MEQTKSLLTRLTLTFLLLTACAETENLSPEQAVKNTLRAVERAAEERSLSGVMEHISPDYKDHQGNDVDAIRRLVQFQFIRNQSIHIYSDIQELSVENELASVEVNAAMASRATDLEILEGGMRADTTRFSVVLRKQTNDQTWLIESVSWRRGWNSN